MRLELEARLEAPLPTVAAILTSAEEAPLWQRNLVRMEVVRGGPNEIGSLARLHYVEGGREYVMEDELVDCEPDRRWLARVSGNGLTAMVGTELIASGPWTLLRMSWDGKPDAWWARPFFAFLRPLLRRRISEDLRSLQRLVASRTG